MQYFQNLAAALVLALMAQSAQAAPQASEISAVLEKICLPLIQGGTLSSAVANAKALGWKAGASAATLANLAKPDAAMTLSAGQCFFMFDKTVAADFEPASNTVARWMTSHLGKIAGMIDTAPDGLQTSSFTTGGVTVMTSEMTDYETMDRKIGFTMSKK